jgi:hypothetical protein
MVVGSYFEFYYAELLAFAESIKYLCEKACDVSRSRGLRAKVSPQWIAAAEVHEGIVLVGSIGDKKGRSGLFDGFDGISACKSILDNNSVFMSKRWIWVKLQSQTVA